MDFVARWDRTARIGVKLSGHSSKSLQLTCGSQRIILPLVSWAPVSEQYGSGGGVGGGECHIRYSHRMGRGKGLGTRKPTFKTESFGCRKTNFVMIQQFFSTLIIHLHSDLSTPALSLRRISRRCAYSRALLPPHWGSDSGRALTLGLRAPPPPKRELNTRLWRQLLFPPPPPHTTTTGWGSTCVYPGLMMADTGPCAA